MIRHLLGRLAQSAVLLAVMSLVIYGLIGLMPGDPVDLMIAADPKMTSQDAERLRTVYGLDRPLIERYLAWLEASLGGDLGYSRLFARPVADVLADPLVNTLLLMGLSFFLSLAIALPAGIAAALRPYSWLDHAINLIAFVGLSAPSFWLALVLIIVFSVQLGWLPAGGMGTLGGESLWQQARFLVLPVSSLTLASVGGHLRYIRAAMIETLSQDYIRTAHAKGLSPWAVVCRHALRNGLVPVVTIIGLEFGTLFSGALVTETIFAYPGMGKLIFDAVMGNDFNLAMVALVLATAVTFLANLGADVAYVALDPRVSFRRLEP
jgi:peptide/nickel transport system permease protein